MENGSKITVSRSGPENGVAAVSEAAPAPDTDPSDDEHPGGRSRHVWPNEPEKRALATAGTLSLVAAAIEQIAGSTAGNPGKSILFAAPTIVVGGLMLVVIIRVAPAIRKKFRISYWLAGSLILAAFAIGSAAGDIVPTVLRSGTSPGADSRTGPTQTRAHGRAVDCHALVDSADSEVAALGKLQNSITVATPTGRVTGHAPVFGAAYDAVIAGTTALIRAEEHYKSEGGQVTADPKLGGDLIQINIDLTNLHRAVLNRGLGGAQWNQLSNYEADFQQLAQMACPS